MNYDVLMEQLRLLQIEIETRLVEAGLLAGEKGDYRRHFHFMASMTNLKLDFDLRVGVSVAQVVDAAHPAELIDEVIRRWHWGKEQATAALTGPQLELVALEPPIR